VGTCRRASWELAFGLVLAGEGKLGTLTTWSLKGKLIHHSARIYEALLRTAAERLPGGAGISAKMRTEA
jgi:hypothetical protein